jgi:hypothetical protein
LIHWQFLHRRGHCFRFELLERFLKHCAVVPLTLDGQSEARGRVRT